MEWSNHQDDVTILSYICLTNIISKYLKPALLLITFIVLLIVKIICSLYFLFFFLAVVGLRYYRWAFSSCRAWASHQSGLSSCSSQLLGTWPSIVAAPRAQLWWCGGPRVCRLQRLWHRAQIAQGMWNLPRPGIEPMSPALAGGFPSTGPPGKSWKSIFEM